MVRRILVAVVGAVVITAGILLGMNGLVEIVRKRDPTRYFQVTDVLPSPDRGRPERPADAARPPERRAPEYLGEGGQVAVEAPAQPEIGAPAPEAPRPLIETPAQSDEP